MSERRPRDVRPVDGEPRESAWPLGLIPVGESVERTETIDSSLFEPVVSARGTGPALESTTLPGFFEGATQRLERRGTIQTITARMSLTRSSPTSVRP